MLSYISLQKTKETCKTNNDLSVENSFHVHELSLGTTFFSAIGRFLSLFIEIVVERGSVNLLCFKVLTDKGLRIV